MSEAVKAAIKSRGGADAIEAYKKSTSECTNCSYSVSGAAVTESFVGYICVATVRVTYNLLFVKNTEFHKVELIYGLDGEYRQVKSINQVSGGGFGLNV